VYRYQSKSDDQAILRLRIKENAAGYGYKRIYVLLRREGWKINHKRVYRLYCEEGLNLRRKSPKRRIKSAYTRSVAKGDQPNASWSMDFMSDALYNGKRFRILTVIDNYTRESLTTWIGQHLKGGDVVDVLNLIAQKRSFPARVLCDNGPEFTSKELDRWAYENNVSLDFSRPGRPMDNGYIESFNGSLRDECLNTNWFLSFEDAETKINSWREEYNVSRPHMSLNYRSPLEFVKETMQSKAEYSP
jgi:putative transposase